MKSTVVVAALAAIVQFICPTASTYAFSSSYARQTKSTARFGSERIHPLFDAPASPEADDLLPSRLAKAARSPSSIARSVHRSRPRTYKYFDTISGLALGKRSDEPTNNLDDNIESGKAEGQLSHRSLFDSAERRHWDGQIGRLVVLDPFADPALWKRRHQRGHHNRGGKSSGPKPLRNRHMHFDTIAGLSIGK